MVSNVRNYYQDSQPGSTKNPYSRCHDAIKKNFCIWKYRSAMNSSELPYYYHIFLVFKHKKLTFSLFWGSLETNCSLMASLYQGKWVKTSKSELIGKNPSELTKILMRNEICPFILTQAEYSNSKD